MTKTLLKIIRNGLIYGIVFFTLSFLLGYYSFHMTLKNTLISAAPIALLALTVNGITYSRFTKSKKALESINLTSYNLMALKLQSPANHYIGDNLISGKLFLTDTNLIFKAYQKEADKQKEHSFALNDYHSFKFYPSLFNTGGEFTIQDNNGHKFVFEVDELKLWKGALT